MHRTLEISEANTTPYISKSSGISRRLKTSIARSRYLNRAVTPFRSLPHLLKFSGYATEVNFSRYTLNIVEQHPNLGVIIDHQLSWKPHVDYV